MRHLRGVADERGFQGGAPAFRSPIRGAFPAAAAGFTGELHADLVVLPPWVHINRRARLGGGRSAAQTGVLFPNP